MFGETGILQDERGTEPECVEVFGESGVLQAERGEAPASPDVAWPNDWPEDWDAGEWEWEWEEGWWSNGGDEWDWTEWGSETRQEPSMELGPAMRINTHIRFEEPSTPSVGARAKPQTPSSAALAVAVEVANSGGKAVKKSKSKPPALDADDAKSMAKLSAKTLSQIGAQARSARAAARAEMALESSVAPSLSPSTLAKMGPVPVLSAMAGVAQRLARQAHEEQAAVAAAEQEAAEAAEERRCEERAQALRDEMFAEDDLHMQLLQLPTTPAPRPQQAAAKPRRAAVAPVRMATVRSVAEQELEAEGL